MPDVPAEAAGCLAVDEVTRPLLLAGSQVESSSGGAARVQESHLTPSTTVGSLDQLNWDSLESGVFCLTKRVWDHCVE